MKCPICEVKKTLYEDDKIIVFQSNELVADGQISVAPKQHFTIMEQVPDYLLGQVFEMANKMAVTIFDTLKAEGTNITVDNGVAAGQKDAHFLVNIIPRKTNDDLDFTWQSKQLSNEEMSSVEITLKEACKKIGQFEKEKAKPIKEKKKERISEKENYMIKQLMKIP
jgi:histidine triad (HIT) family protein